ncbi:hypothetical protein CsSME_00049123 [Camellia sinensis var. sinensis]
MADFGKEYGPQSRLNKAPQTRKVIAANFTHTVGHQRNRSFAEVVSGRGAQTNAIRTIKAYEEGNGWLYESVVVRLKASSSMDTFKEDIARRGFGEVTVRWGGGRDVVLSFNSVTDMKDKLQRMQVWLKDWCDSVQEWRQGMVIEQERYVWLSCYGVPLNLWSFKTFSSIGETWGAVLAIDEDTLRLNSLHCSKVKIATSSMESINHIINLECKGTIYPMRVCEEQIIVSKLTSDQCTSQPTEWKNAGKKISEALADDQLTDINSRHEEEDDDVDIQLGKKEDLRDEVVGEGNSVLPANSDELDGDVRLSDVSAVAETDMMKDGSEEGGACVSQPAGVGLSYEQYDDGARCRVDAEVYTSGFIRSLSGSDCNRQGIHLEVDLNRAQLAGGLDGSALRFDGLVQSHHNTSQQGFKDLAHSSAGQVQFHHYNPQGTSIYSAHPSQIPSRPANKEKLKTKDRSVSRTQLQKKPTMGKFGVNKRLGASSLNLRK